MGAGWRGFRRIGQAVAVAAAAVLLSAAGLPGARAWQASDPAGAPGAGHLKIYHGIGDAGPLHEWAQAHRRGGFRAMARAPGAGQA